MSSTRSHNPQRDRTQGLGLGLSIARRALSLLGGEINCRSQSGRGTVFEFRLPLDATQGDPVRSAALAESQGGDGKDDYARGKRFVVVEDDELVANAMTSLLKIMGAEVTHCHHAEDALQHAAVGNADYFIVDYMLGGELNGIQLLNRIRHKLDKPIKAVVMTGDTSSSFIREAAESSWTVLHKPIDIAKLISSFKAQES